METFSSLLALCVENSPVTGEFPAQMPMTRSFDIFFDPPLNIRLSKQSWGLLFETTSRPIWRHCNDDKVAKEQSHLGTYTIILKQINFCLYIKCKNIGIISLHVRQLIVIIVVQLSGSI